MDGRGGKGGVGAGQKVYRWHTGYPGGLKQRTAAEMLERRPTELLRRAVMGMIRRNNLRHGYTERRLKIYAGEKHPHANVLGPDVVPLPPVPRSNRTKRGEKTEVKAEGDAVPRPLYQFGLQYGYSPTTYSDLKAAGKTAPSRRAQTGKHTGDRVDETYFEDGEIKFQYMSDDSDSFFVDTREEKLEDFLQEWNEEVETIFAKDLEQAPEDVDNDNEIGKST
uniref:Ribosomal protein L13 n=2 Tax=Corethron hystrix TaxID=216773 RepID=A0A7S1BXH1_9STRA|mmetsp:Transcript_586/g.1146  ORF Transcript_586/g.1146 Transcript_586/m.1146 type:complete len:222 (+) Transcript_586:318-983(+)|eukprot:CAMPEP_0113319664 /NCGR_PEP_ID=MMETSP0010_2-20120614/13776_1 /TAXON_ID=216773 ORGANISM="Corethron hystrix, Strain 308" /NCGR_SAMPLE_ID=MMETSP0010_2 /ASSEMBLY_ACC=CAM_ASM_000155 /LENGTH=221 /DNA_ID=CAMNT_0000177279 /DNA_START=221 /DNA_END=886 /DNA_ORIENTATION=+ /assembly_acc=CAM_ASM_000155